MRSKNRHLDALEAIREFTAEHQYGPTLREIGDLIDVKAVSQVCVLVQQLQLMGLVSSTKGKSRTIVQTELGKAFSISEARAELTLRRSAPRKFVRHANGKRGGEMKQSRKDPDLQKRIDRVVAKALKKDSAGVDVIHDFRREYDFSATRLG